MNDNTRDNPDRRNTARNPAPEGKPACCCGHAHTVAAQAAEPGPQTDFGQTAESGIVVYHVSGMDCPMEEALIRKELNALPCVCGLEFSLVQRVLRVRLAAGEQPPRSPGREQSLCEQESLVFAALVRLNLGAQRLSRPAGQRSPLPASAIPWGRLTVAGLLAAVAEGLELAASWGGLPVPAWCIGVVALAAVLAGGLTTFKKGWLAVTRGNLNMNALMSVAVTGAFCIGQYPEAAMVMTLFALSEAIESKALDKARKAIAGLLTLAPQTACTLQPDGRWQEQAVESIAPGCRIRVRPGEKIALDGVVRAGHSAVDQSPITGESIPVEKASGDALYAGTLNGSGELEFEVTADAGQTTLARIIQAVEEAQSSRAPIQRAVDVFARHYTPAIFALALLTGLLPPLLGSADWGEAIYTGLAVLVIGCPCALVIATPVTIVSGMAAAARQGILIKGGGFLEQGRRLRVLALDKTGTLTLGKAEQTDCLPLAGMDAEAVARHAASLAARSDHPVSVAIARAAASRGLELLPVADFTALPGQGVCGRIGDAVWHLGNRRLAAGLGLADGPWRDAVRALEEAGKSVVLLLRGASTPTLEGVLAVADVLRPGSREAVAALRRMGVHTLMLTGDNAVTAAAVAAQAGVDAYHADLLPADKLRIMDGLVRGGAVTGMAGDGINDAPALARAHIGFGMAAGGSDTAMETADVALMDDDPGKIPRFIRLSRAVWAILMQNIALAAGIKLFVFALAFSGHASMWMAVFADVGAALLVIANGLRALRL